MSYFREMPKSEYFYLNVYIHLGLFLSYVQHIYIFY